MKKIKILISIIVVITVLLASYGTLAAGNLTVDYGMFTGNLKVSVNFDKSKEEPVFVQIVPADADISAMSDIAYGLSQTVYVDQKNSDTYGNCVFDIPFGKVTTGDYIVRVHSMTYPGVAIEKPLKHVSLEDLKNAWTDLTRTPQISLNFILDAIECSDEVILSFKNDASLFERISAYDNIGEFNQENFNALLKKIKSDCESIITFRDALKIIASSENYSEVKSILKDESNVAALGISDIIARYNSLKNTRLVDDALVGRTFSDIKEFRKEFIKALENAEKAAESSNSSSSSKSSSGGKSSASLGTSIPFGLTSENVWNLPFKDVDGVAWAKDAIAELYSKGIINGKSADTFAPDDYILREEFVKMMVCFLGLEITDGTTAFADVDSGAWYAPYIATAQKGGFINGYSEYVFGVGNYITRQDVAVILNRVTNLSSNSSSTTFVDESDISDYAKDAVVNLYANGIINGSNGAFMPQKYSTRAETSVMIQRLMQKMKEGVL